MRNLNLNDSPFSGQISRLPLILKCESLDCRHCGSSLAGRLEGRRRRRKARAFHVIDVYRCACGHSRQLVVDEERVAVG